jgi:hypothetical protein
LQAKCVIGAHELWIVCSISSVFTCSGSWFVIAWQTLHIDTSNQ